MSYLTDIDLEEIVDLVTKKQPTWHTTERSWWKAANLMNNQIYKFFPFVVFFLNRCLFLRSAILKLANFFFPTIYCRKITRLKQKLQSVYWNKAIKYLGNFVLCGKCLWPYMPFGQLWRPRHSINNVVLYAMNCCYFA